MEQRTRSRMTKHRTIWLKLETTNNPNPDCRNLESNHIQRSQIINKQRKEMGSRTIRYPADLFINSCSNKMSRGTIIAQNNAIIQLGYKIERDCSTFCTFNVSKNTKLARICTTSLPEAGPHLHIAVTLEPSTYHLH